MSRPTSISDPFFCILLALRERDIPFVIIGGYAAVAWGSPLPTFNLNICAPLDHALNTRIIEALQPFEPRWRVPADPSIVRPSDTDLQSIETISLTTSLGLFSAHRDVSNVGRFADVVARSSRLRIEDLDYDVLNIDALIDSKRAVGRNRDLHSVLFLESMRDELRRQGKMP